MRWVLDKPFSLSANIHNGDVVVSYPFDSSTQRKSKTRRCYNQAQRFQNHATISVPAGVYATSPDDKYLVYLSEIYANAHSFMASGNPSCNGEKFTRKNVKYIKSEFIIVNIIMFFFLKAVS